MWKMKGMCKHLDVNMNWVRPRVGEVQDKIQKLQLLLMKTAFA